MYLILYGFYIIIMTVLHISPRKVVVSRGLLLEYCPPSSSTVRPSFTNWKVRRPYPPASLFHPTTS